MRTYLDCIPCFFQQALNAARLAGADEETQREILVALGRELSHFSLDSTPPEMGQKIYSLIKERTGRDPFQEIKMRSNQHALSLYPAMKKSLKNAGDPLRVATRLAIVGNVIDYGPNRPFELEKELQDALKAEFAIFQYEEFKKSLSRFKTILYLADNAGEIVFDRLLIEKIKENFAVKVTVAVRGSPVINDATMEDVRQIGLNKICRVISNGSDVPGTLLGKCSKEFISQYEAADLVISKGQGNFESLWGEEKEIYFLLKIKCRVVAGHTGGREGEMALLRGNSDSYR